MYQDLTVVLARRLPRGGVCTPYLGNRRVEQDPEFSIDLGSMLQDLGTGRRRMVPVELVPQDSDLAQMN